MPAIVLTAKPWEGRYEFDDWRLTQRELNDIKVISGVRAGELIEALFANDRAAVVGLTVVILKRAGHAVTADDLWDTKADEIEVDFGTADDADPPTQTASEEKPNATELSSGDDFEAAGV